ncbi:transmembrane protein 268 isoform X2 [Neocloeon triangulifer]|uniref:transmembrane protein 268 isoform X2 n=1 Tax=Neocloeon triangulifer TaxID=2078957 RepID=UPI00286F6754|nr:transmembrane protein 268 isoform X2 [Neocloeon triangulifer]XP_059478633.1 transmembrane protein 268 isoform X2 [Neocloeon triangulifer]
MSTAPKSETPSKGWVKFEDEEAGGDKSAASTQQQDEESAAKAEYNGAVITAETSQVGLDLSRSSEVAITIPKPEKATISTTLSTIDLSADGHLTNGAGVSSISNAATIRQGFVNGDIIVTLLPINTKWPWITPAKFRPELVPEELMAQGLTLTVEDYVQIMELLTNDFRFTMYNICYKRVLSLWVLLAFSILLVLLFSGVTGLTLFGLGVFWIFVNAFAVVFCIWIKIKLNHNLEYCLASVNRHLLRHKILLGLDDRGKLSCHKVNLCFIYFDTTECVKKLQEVIDSEERVGRVVGREETADERRKRIQLQERMDIDDSDIIIQGASTTRLSRKQGRAEMLLLRYSQRWVKLLTRQMLPLAGEGVDSVAPRHCLQARCPCQFIEEHLKYKPAGHCCDLFGDPHMMQVYF